MVGGRDERRHGERERKRERHGRDWECPSTHWRLADQRDSDGQSPLHASTVLPRLLVSHPPSKEIYTLEGLLHCARQLLALEVLEAAVEEEVLPARQLLPQQTTGKEDRGGEGER